MEWRYMGKGKYEYGPRQCRRTADSTGYCWQHRPKTPRPQEGTWTLTAPDGRTWTAESPLAVCGLEQRERIPPSVAIARIMEDM